MLGARRSVAARLFVTNFIGTALRTGRPQCLLSSDGNVGRSFFVPAWFWASARCTPRPKKVADFYFRTALIEACRSLREKSAQRSLFENPTPSTAGDGPLGPAPAARGHSRLKNSSPTLGELFGPKLSIARRPVDWFSLRLPSLLQPQGGIAHPVSISPTNRFMPKWGTILPRRQANSGATNRASRPAP